VNSHLLMNKSLLKGPTRKTIMLDYLSCLFLQNLHGSHAAQALAEIVYLCDNCSFVLFSLAYDWQNFGEWWITMSIVYLALASFSAVSHIVMYDLIIGQVLSLLELPLRIAAWMVQIRANQWRHVSEEFYRLELIYRGSFWHDQSWDMDLLLLQFCAIAKEKMEHAIILRMAKCFEVRLCHLGRTCLYLNC
jgi:hypothetical protein